MSTITHAQNGITVSTDGGAEKTVNIPENHIIVFAFKDLKTKTYYLVIRKKGEMNCNEFKIYSGLAGKDFSEIANNHGVMTADDFVFATPLGEMKFLRHNNPNGSITTTAGIIDLHQFP